MAQPPVIIIGAGLAGLRCAKRLHAAGLPTRILEAGDRVGGRLGSQSIDGFTLDRGFQVLLDAYPELPDALDLAALDLRRFAPGARIQLADRTWTLADPRQAPWTALRALPAPIHRLGDLLSLHRLRRDAVRPPLDALLQQPETTTHQLLRRYRVSPRMIERFFRPFFGGVFLDRSLNTSSRMFWFTMRMFALGRACLPAHGMQAIADQMAASLPDDVIQLRQPVRSIAENAVVTADGMRHPAQAVVIATDMTAANALLQSFSRPPASPQPWQSTISLWFASPRPPYTQPLLTLNGLGPEDGPVNHLAIPTNIAPDYAPDSRALITANIVDSDAMQLHDDALVDRTLQQMQRWFGPAARQWQTIAVQRIDYALPRQHPPSLDPWSRPTRIDIAPSAADAPHPPLFVAGDHREQASINGALASGRHAAQAVIDALGNRPTAT